MERTRSCRAGGRRSRSRLRALALAAALGAPALAVAAPPVLLQIEGELPFRREDLLDLLRLRLPVATSGAGLVRAVVRGERDQVAISVGGRARTARMARDAGLAGARLVTLLLLDLVSEDLPLDRTAAPPTIAAGASSSAPAPAPSGWAPRFAVGVAGMWTPLVHDDELSGAEPQLELGLRLHRRLLGFLQLGYSWSATNGPTLLKRMHQLPLRLGLGLHTRYLEVRGGLVVRPYWVTTRAADPPENPVGAEVGGTLQLKLRLPIGRGLLAYALVGADFLGKRDYWTDYSDNEFHTNWVVPTAGLGVAYEWGR
jgi:opacity protein-like surface antigen